VPLTPADYSKIETCFGSYLTDKRKKEDNDYRTKNGICVKIEQKIKAARTDEELIHVIVEIGQTAHQNQDIGTYLSDCTEVLFAIIHFIRQKIASNVLEKHIVIEEELLSDLRKRYVNAQYGSQEKSTVDDLNKQIDAQTLKLVYLGNLNPLLERYTLEEIKQLYTTTSSMTSIKRFGASTYQAFKTRLGYKTENNTTGYRFSPASFMGNHKVSIFIPLAWQLSFAEIYSEQPSQKNISEVKVELPQRNSVLSQDQATQATNESILANQHFDEKETGEEKRASVVSPEIIHQIKDEITHYLLNSNEQKDSECNILKDKLDHNVQDASRWIKILFEIGKDADDIQKSGYPRCTETFYLAIHFIRQQLRKNAPHALKKAIEDAKKELDKLRKEKAFAILNCTAQSSIEHIQNSIELIIQKLAHLGEFTPFVELKPEMQQKLYPGKEVSIAQGLVSYMNGKVTTFEYPLLAKHYGYKVSTCIPNVLQEDFIERHKKKHEEEYISQKIKLLSDHIKSLASSLISIRIPSTANNPIEKTTTQLTTLEKEAKLIGESIIIASNVKINSSLKQQLDSQIQELTRIRSTIEKELAAMAEQPEEKSISDNNKRNSNVSAQVELSVNTSITTTSTPISTRESMPVPSPTSTSRHSRQSSTSNMLTTFIQAPDTSTENNVESKVEIETKSEPERLVQNKIEEKQSAHENNTDLLKRFFIELAKSRKVKNPQDKVKIYSDVIRAKPAAFKGMLREFAKNCPTKMQEFESLQQYSKSPQTSLKH